MNKEISEQDKKNFSEYVKRGNLDQARMIVYRLAGGIKITETEKYENAKAFFLEGFKQGNLEVCVAMIQQYPNILKEKNELQFRDNHYQGEQEQPDRVVSHMGNDPIRFVNDHYKAEHSTNVLNQTISRPSDELSRK